MPSPSRAVHAVARSSSPFQKPNESIPTASPTAIVPINKLGAMT